MKLLKALKYINLFTNNILTPKEEAEQVLNYMLLKNNTIRSIEIFEALELSFKCEMKKREAEASYVCRLVNSKYPKEPKIYDPNFDKPLSEMNLNFEIVEK